MAASHVRLCSCCDVSGCGSEDSARCSCDENSSGVLRGEGVRTRVGQEPTAVKRPLSISTISAAGLGKDTTCGHRWERPLMRREA